MLAAAVRGVSGLKCGARVGPASDALHWKESVWDGVNGGRGRWDSARGSRPRSEDTLWSS